MQTSKPHEDRLAQLKAKEADGTINEGERIEMRNIVKHLESLRPGHNPKNKIDDKESEPAKKPGK